MSGRYRSIDVLQSKLGEGVFSYASDKKKAAGRALGTFVEIITYYLLKDWGLLSGLAIERGLSEFANPGVTHNVEFTLHPNRAIRNLVFGNEDIPLTARKILGKGIVTGRVTSNCLLDKNLKVKNSCTVIESENCFCNAYLDGFNDKFKIQLRELSCQPFAMFECKRVGVEKGQKKGPQTIEKAKQGAYVARTVSSVQRVRLKNGDIGGFAERNDGTKLISDDYYELLGSVVKGLYPDVLKGLILTVGVVSNHGNWFTSENRNKELDVLAQSYDWLLFLTDDGLASFIEEVVLPKKDNKLPACREAFYRSYSENKSNNVFTKSSILYAADIELTKYFRKNRARIAKWFNLISPSCKTLADLKCQLKDMTRIMGDGE